MIVILEGDESVWDYQLPTRGADVYGDLRIWRSPQDYAREVVLQPLIEQVEALHDHDAGVHAPDADARRAAYWRVLTVLRGES